MAFADEAGTVDDPHQDIGACRGQGRLLMVAQTMPCDSCGMQAVLVRSPACLGQWGRLKGHQHNPVPPPRQTGEIGEHLCLNQRLADTQVT